MINNITYVDAVCTQTGIKDGRKLQSVGKYGKLDTLKIRLVIIKIKQS